MRLLGVLIPGATLQNSIRYRMVFGIVAYLVL